MIAALTILRTVLGFRIPAGVALALLLAVVAVAVGQCSAKTKARGDLQKMQTSLTAARADLKVCKTNTITLEGAIDRQNAAVAALGRESEAKVAESRKAVSAARSVAESHRKRAETILASRATGDRCLAASKLISEFAG